MTASLLTIAVIMGCIAMTMTIINLFLNNMNDIFIKIAESINVIFIFAVKSFIVCFAIACLAGHVYNIYNMKQYTRGQLNGLNVRYYSNNLSANDITQLSVSPYLTDVSSTTYNTINTIYGNELNENSYGSQLQFANFFNNGDNNINDNFNDAKIIINPNKKILVIYTFDDVYKNDGGVAKFSNVNKFVNFVINTFDEFKNNTEVAIKLTSGGGNAILFTKAYSDIYRLTENGYKTYALIDTVCASGCYMMACGCSEIIANNHSTIGSIGAISTVYNAGKLSDIIGIKELTFKTSNKKGQIPLLRETNEEEINHQHKKINDIMKKFIEIIKKTRPQINDKYFDADVMFAEDAIDAQLIDKVKMIDEFIREKEITHNIVTVNNDYQSQNKMNDVAASIINTIHDEFMYVRHQY
jgi:ClpP class serine protease